MEVCVNLILGRDNMKSLKQLEEQYSFKSPFKKKSF